MQVTIDRATALELAAKFNADNLLETVQIDAEEVAVAGSESDEVDEAAATTADATADATADTAADVATDANTADTTSTDAATN